MYVKSHWTLQGIDEHTVSAWLLYLFVAVSSLHDQYLHICYSISLDEYLEKV
jgi:hypothetical protein